MKTNKRFIQSVIKAAKDCDTEMPWARGSRREKAITRRKSVSLLRKTRVA